MIVATLVACLSAAGQDKRQRETDTKEVTVKAFGQAIGSSFGMQRRSVVRFHHIGDSVMRPIEKSSNVMALQVSM